MGLREKQVITSLTTPHSWKNHDVNRGMRVEPKEMLKQNRIATEFGIENADSPDSFQAQERESDCEHRRGHDDDDAGAVHGPNEKGQAEPGQTGRSQFVGSDDEVESSDYGTEPGNKNRSEEHTSELQSRLHLVCRLLLEKKKNRDIDRSS